MANSNAPFGFRAVNSLGSASANTVKQYLATAPTAASTAIYVGDPVKLAGDAAVYAGGGGTQYYPTVVKATSTAVIAGVCVGIVPKPGTLDTPLYISSSETISRLILVNVDPNQIYEIQADGTFTATMVGRHADFTLSTGNTATGISNAVLATSTVETATTLDFNILNIAPEVDNALGAYTRVLVRLNNTQFGSSSQVGI